MYTNTCISNKLHSTSPICHYCKWQAIYGYMEIEGEIKLHRIISTVSEQVADRERPSRKFQYLISLEIEID